MTPLMLRILPALIALTALTGCTRTLTVTVDGYAESATPVKSGTYRLAPMGAAYAENDLRYRSRAATVESAFAAAGWTRAADDASATTLIRFRYDTSGPLTEVREYDTPEFGVTGYHLTQTRETDASGKTVSRSQMTPAFGQTGYRHKTDAHVSFEVALTLEAYDLTRRRADGNPPQIWKTIITTRDPRGDERALLPVMLKAATPFIAADTRGLKEIEIPAPESK